MNDVLEALAKEVLPLEPLPGETPVEETQGAEMERNIEYAKNEGNSLTIVSYTVDNEGSERFIERELDGAIAYPFTPSEDERRVARWLFVSTEKEINRPSRITWRNNQLLIDWIY